MSTLLGLDLGVSAMKLAVGDRSGVSQIASVLLPSDLIRDRKMVSEEAVAQEVKHALREQHMKKRPCAVVIPAESAIVRRLTVPYMSPEQLRVNLPYEFHDFVQGDKDQYFYDYAVVAVGEGRKGEDGKEEPPTLDLLAVQTRRSSGTLRKVITDGSTATDITTAVKKVAESGNSLIFHSNGRFITVL